MKIYNTLSKRKEEFVPLEEGKVKMYVCGPTVYNLIHIGNARPMIVFDTVRRYMEHKGYEVNYVSNFTDVDDKIIAKAIEEGTTAEEVSQRYIAECKKDMADMNVKPATTHPLATQEIDGMINMIQTLIDKGFAYPVADGTVYFRVKKFKEYGKLSHKNLMIYSPGSALCRCPEKIRRKIRSISFSGNRKKKVSRPGHLRGVTVVRAGILSVLSCPKNILARRLTFMPAGRILFSRIMKMRLHRVSAAMENSLHVIGCTMHF